MRRPCLLPLLDDVEPDALRVRAVNTVVLDGRRRSGFNTDVTGLVGILRDGGVSGTAAP